jgi:hypothetical protein
MRSKIILIFIFSSFVGYSQDFKIAESYKDTDRSLEYLISSDSITFDNHFGDSFRLFIILDSDSKDTLYKEYLPVNLSPDFSYYFIKEYYEIYDILLIQGAQCCFLFYPDKLTLSSKICPDLSDCAISDMQGTYISQLRIMDQGEILELQISDCLEPFKYDISSEINIIEIK